MRCFLLACMVLSIHPAHQSRHQPCFALTMMVGFGQSNRRPQDTTTAKKEGKSVASKPSAEPKATVAAGDLPEDAFSQFPPLSAQQQSTLRTVEDVLAAAAAGAGGALPPEVVSQIQERHGFKLFDEKLFPGIRLLHADPVVFEVEDFFTPEECDTYVSMSTTGRSGRRKGGFKSMELQSATTSADPQFQQQRTSTTWFHHYASAPELLAKASGLLGVEDHRQWEEPQTVRYRPGEKFSWHLDALPPTQTGASKGGQRTATILVYLTDLNEKAGGATAFRDLGPLRVRPKKGKCLVFFPSYGGEPGSPFDSRVLHSGEVVGQVAGKGKTTTDKYIAQLWCHKRPYPPSVPQGSSHEAAEQPIADYDRRWRGLA